MKRGLNLTLTLCTVIILVGCGRYVYVSGNTDIERQSPIPEITTEEETTTEPATEAAESICSGDQDTVEIIVSESTEPETATDETEPDIYSMDVWDLGLYMYGIPYEETTRCLKLITYEGYSMDSTLAYYCACCCVVREIENLWGYSNIYEAYGEIDTSYGIWQDALGYEDWAISALWNAYADLSYVCYCNGMTVPESYVYYNLGIYVW